MDSSLEEKIREIEGLCRQLEFTNLYIKANLDTAISRQLILDNEELIKQVRLSQ